METELSTQHEHAELMQGHPQGHPQQGCEPTEPGHERQHGRSRMEGSPSLRGCDSSLAPPQVQGHPQADDADSHQVLITLLLSNR